MKTSIYIDGFNLYYGCIKNTSCHWLDVGTMCRLLLPNDKIHISPIGSGYAKVIKTEEKGSDVNIATHLLVDGFRNDYELAVVVSNDSDLLLPIQVVTQQFGKPVGLLNPQKHTSVALLPHVQFVKKIRASVLKNSMFPDVMSDKNGQFSKPTGW